MNKQYEAKVIDLRYIKGESTILTGIKQKDARKLESKGAIGGCGTYRVNIPSTLEIAININEKLYFLDIKNIIKNEFGFKNFTRNRIAFLQSTLPKEISIIYSDDENPKLDLNSQITKDWFKLLHGLFGIKGLIYISPFLFKIIL